MSRDITFGKCFHGLFSTNIKALVFRIVFKICCKASSIYLAIDMPKKGGALERGAKSKAPTAGVLKSLSKSPKSEDPDTKKAE